MNLPFYKIVLSYFYPLILKTYPSKISGTIELSLQNGKLVVDSETANYSYGSLHTVFQKVIKEFDFPRHENRRDVLILGFGAGSIAHILNVEKQLNLKIDAVELDEVMIQIYEDYFKKEEHQVSLYQIDTLDFLHKSSMKYDYIFVDVFENLIFPEELKTKTFLAVLNKISHPYTQIAINTILDRKDAFIDLFFKEYGRAASIKQLDQANIVLLKLPQS